MVMVVVLMMIDISKHIFRYTHAQFQPLKSKQQRTGRCVSSEIFAGIRIV
jgi:hypothetical protein